MEGTAAASSAAACPIAVAATASADEGVEISHVNEVTGPPSLNLRPIPASAPRPTEAASASAPGGEVERAVPVEARAASVGPATAFPFRFSASTPAGPSLEGDGGDVDRPVDADSVGRDDDQGPAAGDTDGPPGPNLEGCRVQHAIGEVLVGLDDSSGVLERARVGIERELIASLERDRTQLEVRKGDVGDPHAHAAPSPHAAEGAGLEERVRPIAANPLGPLASLDASPRVRTARVRRRVGSAPVGDDRCVGVPGGYPVDVRWHPLEAARPDKGDHRRQSHLGPHWAERSRLKGLCPGLQAERRPTSSASLPGGSLPPLMATILDGKQAAKLLRARLTEQVAMFGEAHGRVPRLEVILVGDDPASQVYVRNKERAAGKVGLRGAVHRLPGDTTQATLEARVDDLNADEGVDGILVQLPLPPHLNAEAVLDRIDPTKDVDGLHPVNVGMLAAGRPGLRPCTPSGCMELLRVGQVPIDGARAVVIGRSQLVGRPLAQLLLAQNATVTIAHSRTRELPALCRDADILVAAVGRPEFVRGDWVKDGAAVVDVGINRREDGSLAGDVAFEEASERAGWITPVPGGVGPMTIAMLLSNTLQAARARGS